MIPPVLWPNRYSRLPPSLQNIGNSCAASATMWSGCAAAITAPNACASSVSSSPCACPTSPRQTPMSLMNPMNPNLNLNPNLNPNQPPPGPPSQSPRHPDARNLAARGFAICILHLTIYPLDSPHRQSSAVLND